MVSRMLVLIALLIFSVASILLVNVVSTMRIKDSLVQMIDHDVSQITQFSNISQRLSRAISTSDILIKTFPLLEGRLEDRIQLSIAEMETIAVSVQEAGQESLLELDAYFRKLKTQFDHCTIIFSLFKELKKVESSLEEELENLDTEVLHKELAVVADQSQEAESINQLAIMLPGFREIYTEIVIETLWLRYRLGSENVYQSTEKSILSLLEEFRVGLQTMPVSWEKIVFNIRALERDIVIYKQLMKKLFVYLNVFELDYRALKNAELEVMTGLSNLNHRVFANAHLVKEKTSSNTEGTIKKTVVLSVLILLVLGAMGLYIITLVRPIRKLSESATRIGQGDLDFKVDLDQQDELGQLAASFNQMAANLKATTVSKGYLSNIVESMNDGLIVTSQQGVIKSVNRALCELVGLSAAELTGKHITKLMTGLEGSMEAGTQSEQTEHWSSLLDGERELLSRAGEEIPVQVAVSIMPIQEGHSYEMVIVATDVTEVKKTQQSLLEREQLLINVFESMHEGLLVLDKEFRYTTWNRSMEKTSNTPREQVVGMVPWEKFAFLRGEVEAAMKGAMQGKGQLGLNLQYHLPDGTIGWTEESYYPLRDSDGAVTGVVGVIADITEKKQAENELRQLRNYLENIINSMPSILVGVDNDGHVTQWNNTVAELSGIATDAALGQTITDVLPQMAVELDNIKASIRTCNVLHERKTSQGTDDGGIFVHQDVTIYPLVTNGVEGAVIRIDDVTEKVRLEEMMIQSEKMLSVGGLAAGMAHEINNPLAGMLQTAAVMGSRLGGDLNIPANKKAADQAGISLEAIGGYMEVRGIHRMLKTISASGERVASIVNNMLSFARKSDADISTEDMGKLVDTTLELAATDYDLKKMYDFRQIEVVKEYGDETPAVVCEKSKIQQVVLNILRNGAQAMQMSDTPAPQFVIRIFTDQLDWVCVEIKDNGPGMDEATSKRVFEPFFTTKPTGTGTGLGLSVSYFIIVENHGGEMAVDSQLGQGTTFTIRLPIGGNKGGNNGAKAVAVNES